MKQALPALLVGLALCAAATASQQPTFKSAVDLVRLDLLVVRNGQAVAGLTASDFQVYDNGVRQEIDRVSFEQVPIDVVLLFDTSGSVQGPKLYYLIEAGHAFVRGLQSGDRAALMTFASRVRLRSGLNGALESVDRLLDRLEAAGTTALLDGVYWSLMVPKRGNARQAVLLFSDGLDNASWLTADDLLQVVYQSDAVIYSVGLRRIETPSFGAATLQGRAVVGGTTSIIDNRLLEKLAEESGGQLFYADTADRLRPAFERALAEMKARYLLTYYPRGVERAGWHTVRVALTEKRGDVIARRGYLVTVK